jgi:hypothetical protein
MSRKIRPFLVAFASLVILTVQPGATPTLDSINRECLARVYISGCGNLYDSDYEGSTEPGPLNQSVHAVFLSETFAGQISDLSSSEFTLTAAGNGWGRSYRPFSAGAWERSVGHSIYDIRFTPQHSGGFVCSYDLFEAAQSTHARFLLEEVGGPVLIDDSGTTSSGGAGTLTGGVCYHLFVRAAADSCTNSLHNATGSYDFTFEFVEDLSAVDEETPRANLPPAILTLRTFPNPFVLGQGTVIEYGLPTDAHVLLTVHDIAGRKIATLTTGSQPAGWCSRTWAGNDDYGNPVAQGVYLMRLLAGEHLRTQRLVFAK